MLRFEDLDVGRVRPQIAEQQAADLRWLGLDWDGDAVFQHDRLGGYARALGRLEAAGATYPCFCSRADIRAAAAPHGDEGPVYPGTCRAIPAEQAVARLAAGEPAALRLRLDGTVRWRDAIHGPQVDDLASQCGDIVIRRRDGVVAYQLAVVVDDHAQGVTHVLRGDDLRGSTGRQHRLRELLGLLPHPEHAHVPLVVGGDGERLAKRHGVSSLRELRTAGVRPAEVVGRLAHVSGLAPTPEATTPGALVGTFSPGAIARGPTVLPSSLA